MLRVAKLSAWHVHAGEYANRFKRRSDCKLTVMWDELPERGKRFAEEHGMEFEPDLDKLLARDDVDAVCIDAPTNMHAEVIVKAANAGKHIFTEKVLCLTMDECAQIKAAIEKAGVKFGISYPHRSSPRAQLAKRVVEEGVLGQITYCRVRNAHSGASDNWLPAHFYDAEQCGGGAMMDLGAHPMYLIRWLMGKPTEMSSAFTYVTGKAVEDNAVSVMKFANGAIAVSETGFVSNTSPFVLELQGTRGTLHIEDENYRLNANAVNEKINEHSKGWVRSGWVTPARPQELAHPLDMFVEGVLNGKDIPYNLDDAIALTEMMVAAYKSHKDGAWVKV